MSGAEARQAARLATVAALAKPVQHDLNNLMTVVFGNLQMLQRGAAEGSVQLRQLGRVETAARRFEATVRAILSLARRAVPGEIAAVAPAEALAQLQPLLTVLFKTPEALQMAPLPEAVLVRLDRAAFDEALLLLAREAAPAGPLGLALGTAEAAVTLDITLPAPPTEAVLAALRAAVEPVGGSLATAPSLRLTWPRS